MARMRAPTSGFTPAPISEINEPATFLGPPTQPAFDLIEILPPASAELLRKLRLRVSEAHALTIPFSEIQEANTARQLAEQRLKRLVDPAHDGGFNLGLDDARVIVQQRTLDKLTDDAKRLSERSELRAKAWREAGAALQNTEVWRPPHGVTLQDFEAEPVKLAKGENGLLDAIENRRRRVRELRADLHRIESAPYPSSYAKQRMREMVQVLAQRGGVNVSPLVEHLDGKLQFQRELLRVQMHNVFKSPAAIGYAEAVDPVALIAWLLKDTLIKRLDAEIDAESDDEAALSPEAREKAEAEVLSDIVANDRDESWLVFEAQAQNLPCEHRADVSAPALLGLRLVTAAATNGRATSPEHMMITFAGGPR